MYIYTHTCIYHIYIHVLNIHICKCIYIFMYIYICIYSFKYIYVYIYKCVSFLPPFPLPWRCHVKLSCLNLKS